MSGDNKEHVIEYQGLLHLAKEPTYKFWAWETRCALFLSSAYVKIADVKIADGNVAPTCLECMERR